MFAPQHISGRLFRVWEVSSSSYGTRSDSFLEGSSEMCLSLILTNTIKDRPDLARTSHFPLGVPVRLLSSLSKIPQGQKAVL